MKSLKDFMRLISDPDNMEIIRLAAYDALYPSQIASRLKKSKGLITKKLKELEEHGILKARFEKKGASIVKKFDIVEEEILLRVNFKKGMVDLEKKIEENKIKPSERVKELLR